MILRLWSLAPSTKALAALMLWKQFTMASLIISPGARAGMPGG
jgi:hypothetical protein